jgi:chloride channel protein, CIC family
MEQPDGRLVGVITRRQLLKAKVHPELLAGPAWRLANQDVVVTHPVELVYDALDRMRKKDLPWLPVVDEANPGRVIGYLTRDDALASTQWIRTEHEVIRGGVISSLPGMAR